MDLINRKVGGETNHSDAVTEKNDRRNEASESQAAGEVFPPLRVKSAAVRSRREAETEQETLSLMKMDSEVFFFFKESNVLMQMFSELKSNIHFL